MRAQWRSASSVCVGLPFKWRNQARWGRPLLVDCIVETGRVILQQRVAIVCRAVWQAFPERMSGNAGK